MIELAPEETGTVAQRQQLEHSLATTFVELQRERNPERRQGLWLECQRLARGLEKLDNETTNTI